MMEVDLARSGGNKGGVMKRKAIILEYDETGRLVPVEIEIDEPDPITAPPPPPPDTPVRPLPRIAPHVREWRPIIPEA